MVFSYCIEGMPHYLYFRRRMQTQTECPLHVTLISLSADFNCGLIAVWLRHATAVSHLLSPRTFTRLYKSLSVRNGNDHTLNCFQVKLRTSTMGSTPRYGHGRSVTHPAGHALGTWQFDIGRYLSGQNPHVLDIVSSPYIVSSQYFGPRCRLFHIEPNAGPPPPSLRGGLISWTPPFQKSCIRPWL